jgi:predicted porin
MSVNKGDQIDFANSRLGDQLRLEPWVNWNANRHLLITLQHTAARLDDQAGERIFDADLTDLRLTWQFNVRSFLRFTTQQQNIERNVAQFIDPDTDAQTESRGAQLLYSYQLNPQTVVYAGYSDNHMDNDDLASLTKTDRTFFLKLSYAWVPL